MPNEDLSQDEKPASTQQPTPAVPSKQPPAPVFSVKLIAERASVTMQWPAGYSDQRSGGYGRYGLNE